MRLNENHQNTIEKREVFQDAFERYPDDYDACKCYIQSELGLAWMNTEQFEVFAELSNREFQAFDTLMAAHKH